MIKPLSFAFGELVQIHAVYITQIRNNTSVFTVRHFSICLYTQSKHAIRDSVRYLCMYSWHWVSFRNKVYINLTTVRFICIHASIQRPRNQRYFTLGEKSRESKHYTSHYRRPAYLPRRWWYLSLQEYVTLTIHTGFHNRNIIH